MPISNSTLMGQLEEEVIPATILEKTHTTVAVMNTIGLSLTEEYLQTQSTHENHWINFHIGSNSKKQNENNQSNILS